MYKSKKNLEFSSEISESVFKSKYMLEGELETYQSKQRVLDVVQKYFPEIIEEVDEAIVKKWIGLAGGLWRSANNPNKNVSAINCTTLDQPEDNLESINESWYWWAKFAAYGQGEGIDLSKLRPRGSKLHNSAKESTGAVSFMHTYDGVLNTIAQQGRRGASLISLHISHPDIPEFIVVKDEEGVLESANISVHITDEFMEAVRDNKEWVFSFTNKYETIEKKTNAKELFKFLAEHAWKSGDPGVQFIDTMHKYSNSDYLGYPVVSTNACSEQVLDPHNVCILSSVNLAKYNEYGEEKFKRLSYLLTYILDAFRRAEIEEQRSPSPLQMEKLEKLPRIGIGVTGFADYLIDNKIIYGSEESIVMAKKLFGELTGEAYKASYEIAKNIDGKSFEYYDEEKYKQSPFVKNLLKEGFIEDYHLDYQAHVAKTTIAPNGTVTLIMEAGGGGIEPIFAKYYVRRERSTTGDWKEWFTFNDRIIKEIKNQGLELTKENVELITKDPWWITAHNVDNMAKVDLMAEAQKYIDSAISITYNLPKESTPKEIENIYQKAWEKELKAVAVYREGSKTGVLITDANYNENKKENEVQLDNTGRPLTIERVHAPKRPIELKCDIYQIAVNKEKHLALIGKLDDGSIYEIFVTPNEDNKIDVGKYKTGVIRKVKKGQYQLIVQNGEEKCVVDNISKEFDATYGSLSRFISMGLRHGVDLEFIVTQLQKDTSFTSFEKIVARVLKKYIQEGERVKTSEVCEVCGAPLIYQGGCKTCSDPSCGWSKCE